jgi:cytochrome c
VARGKALFNDPKFGSGTSGMSCNSCHPNGRGLEKSGTKARFNIMGGTQNSLEEAVNICIVRPLQGKAIDPESRDMKDIVSYIKSLGN